ncbi:MAG: hypothetical protein A2Y94_14835 [Caldithrix sp. RBG_13_44_9]|nr:MAG: hypothetical protein A2Y94_14835 [Caldithrix sp. RBG_13_44_9]
MKKLLLLLLILVILIMLVSVSCRKVQRPTPQPGQLNKALLEDLTGIPLEYGTLISVTAHAQYEGWAQLWFVDSLQTIRMVRVQFHTNRIHENVLVIPRN